VLQGEVVETSFDNAPKPGFDQQIDDVFDELVEMAQQVTIEECEGVAPSEPEPKPVRVLIVDDSSFFARQLKNLLESGSTINWWALPRMVARLSIP